MRQVWGIAIAMFLIVAGILTMTINSWNASAFGLQNATVAALVERGTFALVDQVIPGFNLVEGTETFRFGKEVYPMKQPGPTILGAMIYLPLYRLGITYQNHFDYVSHLVTLGTSTMMMAIATVLIFFVGYSITKSWKGSTAAALLFAIGTMIWPYACVSHHDIYGVFFGLLAISLYFWSEKEKKLKYLGWAGFFSTFTLFFTMLPLTLPLVLWGIVAWGKNRQKILLFTLAMIVGLIPTMLFNGLVFGNPLLPPNLAGHVSDTMPLLSITNFVTKLWFYLGSPTTALIFFSPVMFFGILGIASIPRQELWLKRFLAGIPMMQLIHVASMETFGGYQYGPRYLLPVLSCLAIGVAIWAAKKHTKGMWWMFALAVMYSVSVAMMGAIQTVMYQIPGPFAPFVFLRQVMDGNLPVFRMLPVGFTLALAGALLFYKQAQKNS